MSLDLDRAFTSELTRRAAAHLRTASRPRARTPAGDDPLAALIAELAVHATDTHAPRPRSRARRSRSSSRASTARSPPPAPPAPATSPRSSAAATTSATARSRWRWSRPSRPSDSRPPVMRTYVPARLAWGRGRRRRLGPTQGSPSRRHPPSTPRPDSARTSGGRDVRAVQLIATRRVPARATAFGAAPAPRAPRAQADAHPHRTLATRAEPKPPPPCRPQSATGAPCGARPHPSSSAQPSPLRRRVRLWRLTTLATRAYRQQQTRALRSLLVEGQHDEALAALCRRRARQRAAAPRGDRHVVRPAGAWSCSRRSRRASWWRRSCGVGRTASGAWDGCARGCSLSAEPASRSISEPGMSRLAPGTRTALNLPRLRRNE